jgi:hypothetical protein
MKAPSADRSRRCRNACSPRKKNAVTAKAEEYPWRRRAGDVGETKEGEEDGGFSAQKALIVRVNQASFAITLDDAAVAAFVAKKRSAGTRRACRSRR